MIITLDLGTTSNRCLAIDANATIVAQSGQEFPQYYPQAAWVEQDAMELWQSCNAVLQDVLAQLNTTDIVSLADTNQRETTIAWNRDTGQPICPAIVWQCRRTSKRMSHLDDEAKQAISDKTGLRADAYFSASKMEWILTHVPEAAGLLAQEKLCFGTVDSWVIWQLSKGAAFVTDASNASRTLLFNVHTQDYDDELLALFSIPRHALPDVLDSNACFAYTAESITGKAFPIHAVMGDQQSSLFAQCGADQSKVKNTYGTGLFLCSCTGPRLLTSEALLSTVAWRIDGAVDYALEGSAFVGGAMIQWLRDQLELIDHAADTEALANTLQSNDGVYCVPALAGLGAPYWDSSARGLFIGLTRGSTKAHFARAALESLAYQSKDLIDEMTAVKTDVHLDALLVDGGASANDFLMQFQSDILSLAVKRSAIKESTAMGVAGLAGITTGLFSEQAFRETLQIEKGFKPSMPLPVSQQYYRKWQEAVERSKQWQE